MKYSAEDAEIIIKYDLSSTHAKYVDRHMLNYLIQHIEQSGVYPAEQMQTATLEMLWKTSMIDHYKAKYMEYKNIKEDGVPPEVNEKREALVSRITELEKKCAPFLKVFYPGDVDGNNEGWSLYLELVSKQGEDGKHMFNLQHLQATYNIEKEHFENVYAYAKVIYETGDYYGAQVLLNYYRRIGDLDNDTEAKWGKYASEILEQNWVSAQESLRTLQESIDNVTMGTQIYQSEGAQLQARAWLMHWSLFVYFFYKDEDEFMDDGLDKLIDSWLPDMYKTHQEKEHRQWKYLRVVQSLCPHLLRYICAAVIIGSEESGKRQSGQESGHIRIKQRFKDLSRLIDNESRYYKDPITEFLQLLLSDCDFDGAHAKLRECELVIHNDFFLHEHKERFLRQARKMIFENHCRIHSVMDIGMVAKKLNYDTEEAAERYIVKMIRGAHLDAKIDSEANQVLLASQGGSIYRTVREKTKLVRDKTDQLIERLQDRRTHLERPNNNNNNNNTSNSGPKGDMSRFNRA
eukprot:TRINITY_DN8618_c0_g1_i1.p1 TRINITY_DN8618_c0_g1~~TRINITY_DN8618_c0_g1_i1.p1  ORF type:complete len:518 (+),score=152.61 TRINITY_DN8618_c0_g1_i1:72-1625(+)